MLFASDLNINLSDRSYKIYNRQLDCRLAGNFVIFTSNSKTTKKKMLKGNISLNLNLKKIIVMAKPRKQKLALIVKNTFEQ